MADGVLLVSTFLFLVLGAVSNTADQDFVVWDEADDDDTVKIGSRVGVDSGSDFETNTSIIEVFNNCKCVIYYQCDDENYIISNGEGLIDLRVNSAAPRIPCPRKDYVCCKERPPDDDASVRHPEVTPRPSEPTQNPIIDFKKTYKCGEQRATLNVRLLTDDDDFSPTMDGEFPWIAAIYRKHSKRSEVYGFKCGGSLIHPQVVMTACHCVAGVRKSDLKIMVNGKNIFHNIGDIENLERSVTQIIKHPEYHAGAAWNDIALLVLNSPYNISSALINTVCLPNSDTSFDGQRCIASGWSEDKVSDRKLLQKVEVPMVDFSKCQRQLRKTRLGPSFNLHHSFVCAGGEEGRDTCKGDGGGPLVCPIDDGNRFVQAGIVSWGIGCGARDVPGVYANVALFKDWIETELSKIYINLE